MLCTRQAGIALVQLLTACLHALQFACREFVAVAAPTSSMRRLFQLARPAPCLTISLTSVHGQVGALALHGQGSGG